MKKYLLFCIIYISQIFANVQVVIYDSTQYAKGNTIFGTIDGAKSAIIDMYGNEIWNSDPNEPLIYFNFADVRSSVSGPLQPNVKFFGGRYCESCQYDFISTKFSLIEPTGADFVWEDPNLEFSHHEISELPWGDYMGIIHEYRDGPVYPNAFDDVYVDAGCTPTWTDSCWSWQGDRLVIWDKDTKAINWSWSTFVHFDMGDFHPDEWDQIPVDDGVVYPFDWTHVNAFYFDDQDNTILISTRNLSRITKIQYPSGAIIWNMGPESPSPESISGEVTFGGDLGFSWQHSISLTNEDNIILFDNGNYAVDHGVADVPTSRALEIALLGCPGVFCQAELVWEYTLPTNLFSSTSGNAQKLENGNYLITTIANLGTTLEVVPTSPETGEIIWRADYTTEGIYRASRLPSCMYAPGNILGDSFWNVQDIVVLANCVLADNCASLGNSCAANVNGDTCQEENGCATGENYGDPLFNVQDIVVLANCVLADNCASALSD